MLFQFKFIVYDDDIKKVKLVRSMLDNMKTLEVSEVIYRGNQSKVLELLAESPIFETRQDFHNVLTFKLRSIPKDESIYEYVSFL